ncbi:MAG: tRNA epoxyqueuosine(34) reductase QueG [Azospira oryzae]|nr:MAG: tRNA epoxyqueuosine(34) reductase QueG [Azospira oryzae]PZP79606.1 MAG: tRNA epoxyqueuosine(34) reductase QueG [Azospira oryzae]
MQGDSLCCARLEGAALVQAIKRWGRELGFQRVGVTHADLGDAEARLLDWLAHGYHGDMDYMARHGVKRSRPSALVPGTVSVICARMNYLPPQARASRSVLDDPERAFVSRYALGRDYHKVVRSRLTQLARRIARHVEGFAWRAFADSAPVMEVELASRAGVGWRGKHTLLLARDAGSWFFLGEIYTNLSLPADPPEADHCGTCTRCIDACPTQAIIAPYRIDARRCISYLTIEHKGEIPEALRPLMGNRIYGCDDCQLVCPWTRFAKTSREPDFAVRNGLDDASLAALFGWSEQQFLERFAGSPIRRLGYERWLRNIAVALGNAPSTPAVVAALEARRDHPSALVRVHVAWALARHGR